VITNVYIDGFNLYYGCLRRTPYKWLDLEALCHRLLPNDTIHRIRYFTANVHPQAASPLGPQRQQAYLRAIKTNTLVSVHYGKFVSRPAFLPLRHPPNATQPLVEVIRTEEKRSDVNLATYLVLDAFQGDCETAVVISNDGDLKEPVEVVQRELGIPVGVVNPHPFRNQDLRPTFFRQIRPKDVRTCQMPLSIKDQHGVVTKPLGW
jgi:hypothetical protein